MKKTKTRFNKVYEQSRQLLLSFLVPESTSQPVTSKSPSSNSTSSPSVVANSSSVTCMTCQISVSSTVPSSSSVSSPSSVSSSTTPVTLTHPSVLLFLTIYHHSFCHVFTHQTQHSDSVPTVIRLVLIGQFESLTNYFFFVSSCFFQVGVSIS